MEQRWYPSPPDLLAEPVEVDVELRLEFDGTGTDDAHGATEIILKALDDAKDRYSGENFKVIRISVHSYDH